MQGSGTHEAAKAQNGLRLNRGYRKKENAFGLAKGSEKRMVCGAPSLSRHRHSFACFEGMLIRNEMYQTRKYSSS
jgi:hypothetical protein